jgi:hypothetical protein
MARKSGKKKKVRSSQIPMFEGLGKRYYVNRLRWLLDFVNADILNLPPGGFLKVFYEFLAFFYEGYVEDEVLKRLCVDIPEDRQQLVMAGKILSGRIWELLDKLHLRQQVEIHPELKDDPHNSALQDAIKTTQVWESEAPIPIPLSYHLKGERIVLIPEIRIYEYDNLQSDDEIEAVRRFEESSQIALALMSRKEITQKLEEQSVDKELVDLIKEPYDQVPLGKFSKFCDPNIFSTLTFQLYSLLEKFPLSSIYRCPECRKYFAATRKKQSEYCTQCIKKKHVYKWRDKNRPEYNTYQRNLQKGVKTSVDEIRADLAREKEKKEDKNGT